MIQIITEAPVYVWPLLIYLIWGGLKARKASIVPWKALVILPVTMFIWSIYSILTHYGMMSIFLWILSITIGMGLGFLTTSKLSLRFDKQKKLIEVGGNWSPLILSISIFSLRYFLGATYALHPELEGSTTLLIIENIATLVSGMFLGRLISYWQRYKTSPHVDLNEIKA